MRSAGIAGRSHTRAAPMAFAFDSDDPNKVHHHAKRDQNEQ